MQREPYPKRDGYRCWLSPDEQNQLVKQVGVDDLERRLAVELLLDGLRADEVPRVTKRDLHALDVDAERYLLQVSEGKTGYRETPISTATANRIQARASVPRHSVDDPVVSVGKRQVQNWIEALRDPMEESTGDDRWQFVTAHDLRRSWATTCYYRLYRSSVALDLVMQWGGWESEEVFRKNYLGRPPASLVAETMEEAGLV
ncbi:tyrosine-type recombinase/integrase [Haloarculaceae archaeon H-GB2-1]|nr:tyrosine-type recombinase/integrase [Haloarculaceae archaeon H-GB1-1]MEA5408604.1 tyrosine-type recombinase/integrase [Haloarculaceae archaeon H-GB2-1]